jgi:hypothetical protein
VKTVVQFVGTPRELHPAVLGVQLRRLIDCRTYSRLGCVSK